MNKLYTEETLIKFYYEECDILEKLEIENMLENDLDTNISYAVLYGNILNLPALKLSPSISSTEKILAYSKLS